MARPAFLWDKDRGVQQNGSAVGSPALASAFERVRKMFPQETSGYLGAARALRDKCLPLDRILPSFGDKLLIRLAYGDGCLATR